MFNIQLLEWNKTHNKRKMPWKGIKDAYKIWVSEIILQQTRVEQGLNYYVKLTEKYPTVFDLANANEQELFSIWQGLGYYSRCKNMLATAKIIVEKYNGVFPKNYIQILSLKGIGEYTAAAIASFAFNLPHAVVDGNVVRVLSRVFALKENFYSSHGKKYFLKLANDLIDSSKPAAYNQAIMDLGATVCKPQNPLCDICPFCFTCKAYLQNKIDEFPVKKQKLIHKKRHLQLFFIYNKQSIFILKRTEKDIWENLYSFLTLETKDANFNIEEISFLTIDNLPDAQFFKQTLSHQKINACIYSINAKYVQKETLQQLQKIKYAAIKEYGFPKLIISFFKKNNYL